MKMKEFFTEDSLVDNISEIVIQDDFMVLDSQVSNSNSAVKNMTHRRQIEILRENKALMSSLKDVYDY